MSRHLPWIHVELVPLFLQVRNLRRFVRDFCVGMSLRPEYAEHIAMAAAELLEVAAKGASAQWARFDLRLLGTFTEVSVTSAATLKQRETLQAIVSEVSQGEARDAYARSLAKANIEGIAISGLCRLRHEAAAELALTQTEEEVCLIIRAPV
ncbi:MAG: hypothetical protein U0745_01615 [Polyangia bacterium]|jgi:hypothetical protein